MHTNLSLPMTLAELAAITHLSPYHFARQFRVTVGQPPHRYLLDQRLAAARQMLAARVLCSGRDRQPCWASPTRAISTSTSSGAMALPPGALMRAM